MAESPIAEIWMPVEGIEGYDASNLGRVRSWRPTGPKRKPPTEPRILKPMTGRDGHIRVKIMVDGNGFGYKSARLVCIAFHGLPGPGLDHCMMRSDSKTDLSPSNVYWGTIRADEGRTCTLDGCDLPLQTMGFCSAHYQRQRKHNDPRGGRVSPGTLMQWIDDHVGYDGDDCINWPFGTQAYGYGRMTYGGRHRGAHEVMCEKTHGRKPKGKHHVAHSCGNGHKGCVNSRHLRWATVSENAQDRREHGTMPIGEYHCCAKLNECAVIWMRQNFGTVTKAEMARKYGVTFMTVTNALRGKNWKHLNDEYPPPKGC